MTVEKALAPSRNPATVRRGRILVVVTAASMGVILVVVSLGLYLEVAHYSGTVVVYQGQVTVIYSSNDSLSQTHPISAWISNAWGVGGTQPWLVRGSVGSSADVMFQAEDGSNTSCELVGVSVRSPFAFLAVTANVPGLGQMPGPLPTEVSAPVANETWYTNIHVNVTLPPSPGTYSILGSIIVTC